LIRARTGEGRARAVARGQKMGRPVAPTVVAVLDGLLPPEVRAFKGHAAFHRVPESWEF
jgi:hypothetical protein